MSDYYTNVGFEHDEKKPNGTTPNGKLPDVSKTPNGNVGNGHHYETFVKPHIGEHEPETKDSFEMKSMDEKPKDLEKGQLDDDEVDYSDANCITRGMKLFQLGFSQFITNNFNLLRNIFMGVLLVGYSVYFVFALLYSVQGATALIVMTSIAVFFIVYAFLRDHFGDTVNRVVFVPLGRLLDKHWFWLKWIVYLALLAGLITYLAVECIKRWEQLIPVGGVALIIFLEFLFSKHPHKVRLRPVAWGFGLQIVLGILVLRWKPGYDAIEWVADQVQEFMSYTLAAGDTVFGFTILHPFIFLMMPMLIWFAAVMSVLYFFGITQVIVKKMGWFMQMTCGTTAVESLSVSANIFLNGMDTLLMLRPYLEKLTKSEFHAMQVGNQATVAGFVFAVFILLGAPPQHLLTAACMSAPAAMAIAKLNYPETEQSVTNGDVEFPPPVEKNVIESASNGAKAAGKTVTAVVISFIFMLSAIEFLNATLKWIGERVGYGDLTFQLICSYVFWPFAFLMGIERDNCGQVAKLLGIKLFTSEFLAYSELGDMAEAGEITQRSAAIATYALCGFSGLATCAIAIGVWSALVPSRVSWVAEQMLRCVINANMACFLTACVASVLYRDDFSIVNVNGTSIDPLPIVGNGGIMDVILDLVGSIIPKDIMDSFANIILGIRDIVLPAAPNCTITGGTIVNEVNGGLQGILDVLGAILPDDAMGSLNQVLDGLQGIVRPRDCVILNVTTGFNDTMATAETATGDLIGTIIDLISAIIPEDRQGSWDKVLQGIEDLLTPAAVNCSNPDTINPTVDPVLVGIWDIIKQLLPADVIALLTQIGNGIGEIVAPINNCDVTTVATVTASAMADSGMSALAAVPGVNQISSQQLQTMHDAVLHMPQETISQVAQQMTHIIGYFQTSDLLETAMNTQGVNPAVTKIIELSHQLPEHVLNPLHRVLEGLSELLTAGT
ncbi:unnamed protein product [Owenia fusiformis]|uniref:Uncharacterized protein n=1 Tax=Owenia fusiformis TaxID=6347 RepID=A0A8J1Y6P6_OWEFU|nr:unnamed protein product [Owenia fusiformis]